MSNFNLLLKSAISLNNVSNRKLSQSLNIDRSRFQKILSGDRAMDYSTFESICSHLSMPEKLNEELRIAFGEEHFGKDTFDNIQFIISRLNKMAKYETASSPPHTRHVFTNNYQKKYIQSAIPLIEEELKQAEPLIYTNFPFHHREICNYFLDILHTTKQYIDLRHICFDPLNENSKYQIDSFLYACEFAGYGYNTWYHTIHSSSTLAILTPLPYFILTSKSVLFFSDNPEFFMKETKSDIIESMHKYFQELYDLSTPFAEYLETSQNFIKSINIFPAEDHADSTKDSILYGISRNLYDSFFLADENPEKICTDKLFHKHYISQCANLFFQRFRKNHHIFLFDHQSLLSLVDNDTDIRNYSCASHDKARLTPTHKMDILQKNYDFVTSGHGEIYIFNSEKIQVPSYFHMNTLPTGLTLNFNFKIWNPETRNLNLSISYNRNPIIHRHFSGFTEFLTHSPYTFSAEHSNLLCLNALTYYKSVHPELNETAANADIL